MKISLCMIVRDEREDLPRLLASVQGLVDEICIVDTGSTDGTPEIARAAGARVESFAWCADFAAARNQSLAMATGDWVLVLDADEAIEDPAARHILERFAAAHPEHAGQVTIVDRQEQGELRSRVSRYFPRRPDLGYVGRFHEQPHFGASPAPAIRRAVLMMASCFKWTALDSGGQQERQSDFQPMSVPGIWL